MTEHEPAPLGPHDIHLATHLFRPERLTLAREYRGLTKVELAQRIHKTPSALSQFESGRIRPDPQTTAALALALQVPVAFFARAGKTPPLSTDDAFFRSLRSTTQRDRRRLLARAVLLCDLVHYLEDQVDFPALRLSGSAVARDSHTADELEDAALEVRRAWGLGVGPIPRLIDLLESAGIIVTRVPDGCSEVDAFAVLNDYRPVIFLVTEKRSTSRARYDAAHELGHLVLHADVATANPEAEREANRFAGAFLVPRESFLRECPRYLNWEHLYELKRRWRVSVAALVRRAFDLGVFSEATYRRAFMRLNRTGERLQEAHEPPEERPSLLSQAIRVVDQPPEMLCGHLGIHRAILEELLESEGNAAR